MNNINQIWTYFSHRILSQIIANAFHIPGNEGTIQIVTDEVTLDDVVLQGEVWGPILASNQVDMFGKEMLQEDYSFMFQCKGYIPVPVLGQIDDTIGIS